MTELATSDWIEATNYILNASFRIGVILYPFCWAMFLLKIVVRF